MNSTASRPKKKVLLLDMYEWTEAYPATNPLRNVTGWFARYLPVGDTIELTTGGVTDDLCALAREADAVIISGSPRDAWVDDPINDRALEVIEHCRAARKPFLGVCYGHQLLGRALHAEVGRQPAGYELGNIDVTLTDEGAACPLFSGLPRTLTVIESHQDAVLELPEGARLLATGACEVQAFDFHGNMLAVQFHPEMDPAVLQFVWGEPRRELWRPKLDFNLDERLAGLKPTPAASQIFQNFINHYVL
ncbi:MAG TPA: type 1 glutamine amidotransferase [Verrucomicrobiae bacterium]|nr:type 1 glutamine amidotransferase [Verrucomicrobiae bacterium]